MKSATTLVIAGLLLTACTGQNPLRPAAAASDLMSGAAAAAANGATQLRFSVALTVPAFPTCALTPPAAGVITGTGLLTVVIRSTTDGNGGTHVGTTIHGHGTAIDERGASWVWSDADLNNELFPSGNASDHRFEQTITEGFHVIGPHGEQIKVKGTFHITVVDGTTIVEFEKGNHESDEICESGFVLTPLP